MSVVKVTLLGEVAISTELEGTIIAARLTPGGRVVLAVLARQPGAWVPGDALVRSLTTTKSGRPASAKNLSVRLTEVRGALRPGGIAVEHNAGRYRLVPLPGTDLIVDIQVAEAVLARIATATDRDAVEELHGQLESLAVSAPQADLDQFPEFDWLVRELHLITGRIEDARIELLFRLGRLDEVGGLLAAALRRDPDDDAKAVHLIRATYLQRGRGAALALVGELRETAARSGDLIPSTIEEIARRIHVRDPSLGPAMAPVHDFPAALRVLSRRSVIERQSGTAAARAAFGDVCRDGASCVVRIRGPSGYGKTVLAARAAAELFDEHGALVLASWCEQGSAPLGPLRDALDLAWQMSPRGAQASLGAGLSALVRHVPSLDAVERRTELVRADVQRVELVESACRLLAGLAASTPTILVIDDLQAADEITLAVIRRMSRVPVDRPVLVVVTERVEPGGRPLQLRGAREVILDAFDRDELQLLVRTFGDTGDTGDDVAVIADQLFDLTGGWPILAAEILERVPEAVTRPSVLVPTQVMDLADALLARRLDSLGPDARFLLDAAAVLGPSFDWRDAATVAELDPMPASQHFDRATRAGVLMQHEDQPTVYWFEHTLMRAAVLSELSAGRRVFLHARAFRIGAAAAWPARTVAEHARAAVTVLPAAEVANALVVAASDAREQLAFRAALEWIEAASSLIDHMGPEQLVTLRVTEGTASAAVGDVDRSRRAFADAIEIARSAGDARLVTDAVRARSILGHAFVPDEQTIHDLRAAIAVAPAASVERAELSILLAHEHVFGGRVDDVLSALDAADADLEAVDGAAQLRAQSLSDRLTALSVAGAPLDDRRRALDEMDLIASSAGHPLTRLQCMCQRGVLRLHADDPVGADALFGAAADLAEQSGHLQGAWLGRVARFTLPFLSGDLAAAGERSSAAYAFGEAHGIVGAFGTFATQQYALAWGRGDTSASVDALEQLTVRSGPDFVWRAALALSLVDAGRVADARSLLDELAVVPAHEARSLLGVVAVAVMAEAASLVRHERAARRALEFLSAHRNEHVVLGFGAVDYGPAARYIAGCLRAVGQHTEAQQADATSRALGRNARVWMARPVLGQPHDASVSP